MGRSTIHCLRQSKSLLPLDVQIVGGPPLLWLAIWMAAIVGSALLIAGVIMEIRAHRQ